MNKLNGLFGLFAVLTVSFASGCHQGREPMMSNDASFIDRAQDAVKVDPAVSEACKDNGGSCVASGSWDLLKRGYSAVKGAVTDKENQNAVKSAWETTKQTATDGYKSAKDAISK